MELLELQIKLEQLEKYMTNRELLSYALKALKAKQLDSFFDKLDNLHKEQADYINTIKEIKEEVLRYPYISFSEKIDFMEKSSAEIKKKIEQWIKEEYKLSSKIADAILVVTTAIEELERAYPAFSKKSIFGATENKGLRKISDYLKNILRTLENQETIFVLSSKFETDYLKNNLFNVPPLENRSVDFYNSYHLSLYYGDFYEKAYLNPYKIPGLEKIDDHNKKNMLFNKGMADYFRKAVNKEFEKEEAKVFKQKIKELKQLGNHMTIKDIVEKTTKKER